jgi:hypothetical protein
MTQISTCSSINEVASIDTRIANAHVFAFKEIGDWKIAFAIAFAVAIPYLKG